MNAYFKDKFIPTHKITDIQILLYKAKNDYYTSIDEVLIDIIFLFKYINANIENYMPDNTQHNIIYYKLYLNTMYFIITEKVVSLKKVFNKNFNTDLKYILETNTLPKKSK